MKQLMTSRTKSALACFALTLVWPAAGSASVVRHVPAEYPTIQAAVDEATAGDEIRIAAGVYTEQVIITNKSLLTLSGAPGSVLRARPGMQLSLAAFGSGRVPLVGIAVSDDIVVSGLTLEGERLASSQPGILTGIYFLSASGRVEDCRIMGFRGPTNLFTSTLPGSVGIVAFNGQPELRTDVMNVQVSHSTFADNAYSIRLAGDVGEGADLTALLTTFKVNDNTIVGNGPEVAGRQFGVFVMAGASGEIERNIITDHAYVGVTEPIPTSYGILGFDNESFSRGLPLVALQPIRIEGNILRNNQQNLVLVRGDDSTIVNNSFEGREPGWRTGGLLFSGQNVLVATNRFTDLQTGILLFGDDPDFPDQYLGIASNATLIANGFCNVDMNYNFEPLTSHTEQGTLTCPGPPLEIRPVQLSWPYAYNGGSVALAPGLGGPGIPSGPAPSIDHAQNNNVIPAENNHN